MSETAAEENPASYFPILDRIADGHFAAATTDQELHTHFLQLLQDDQYITEPAAVSSFQLALSIRSTAPRIEAHYQFYNTSVAPSLNAAQDAGCSTWVQLGREQFCSPSLEEKRGDMRGESTLQVRQFDRILGDVAEGTPSILYADISDPSFGRFHKALSKRAKETSSSYRLRYKPSMTSIKHPLGVSGYGVELALKRTDYIVIDDRDSEKADGGSDSTKGDAASESEIVSDLKPLSISELLKLGLKTSSYVMQAEDQFSALASISQDFPKHSSALAAHDVSEAFLDEFQSNRKLFLPAGYNIAWINGAQVDPRQFDAFALTQHLRRERKLIDGLRLTGLAGPDAAKLLSHPAITASKTEGEPQRYDYRDEIEGGKVIIWMNDIEKDKRYKSWPASINALLQRTYPGQLPLVRRDVNNVVVLVDLSKPDDVDLVLDVLQTFVKRQVPIRMGVVPITGTPAAAAQAKVVYHLSETYGLASALSYLTSSFEGTRLSAADKVDFEAAVKDRKLRRGRAFLTLPEVLDAEEMMERAEAARKYVARLGGDSSPLPVFANGVALPRNDEWLQGLSSRLGLDLRALQEAVFEGQVSEGDWLPSRHLAHAATRRNALVVPADEGSVRFVAIGSLYAEHGDVFSKAPTLSVDPETPRDLWAQLLVIADLSTAEGLRLVEGAGQMREEDPSVEVMLLNNPGSNEALDSMASRPAGLSKPAEQLLDNAEKMSWGELWRQAQSLVQAIGFEAGQQGLVLNGRLLGPIPRSTDFGKDALQHLLEYERSARSKSSCAALEALGLLEKMDSPRKLATVISLVSLSSISDVPEGIYQTPPSVRVNTFEQWGSKYSAIHTGDPETAIIHVVAAVDPAGEGAQRWVPILKVISELEGVHLKLFLNPREELQELPIKRFYRYVLKSKPSFDEDGAAQSPTARFSNLPEDALLNVAMDVPPSWLVAPKESVHDLDNIKISSLRDRADIDAVYELEHILIEGHSRDVTSGQPPRGAQLMLGTEKDPHYADTLVMANLGYFQFKANPGYWKIRLQEGRSQEIFSIDSAGTKGYGKHPGDESPEIEMLTFQGNTLFPRLSRKPGKEAEDVLETEKAGSAMDYLSKGFKFAESVLSNVGVAKKKHADINIFSVASGHLYERMLNIMMVSVMKHTKSTVKFWFIEQFLSPSFKDFIPVLAAEYGFEYEMVTYKWPHWLRGQKEKQREIWGYKILFLDVLFPLSLDKVIFVDADQIVRTDMAELVRHDLEGAPYGFTPMCDSRTEMEGFRFWKQGYWETFLRDKSYHISALYVVDLRAFRAMAAGDRLRGHYQQLSADPGSLSNLDQDLPNHMQHVLPIHSLPQDWLWCETWCSDAALATARTIDLCNNPLTKEPKLERARRQVPEWVVYDGEIEDVRRRRQRGGSGSKTSAASEEDVREELKAEAAEAAREAEAAGGRHEEL
ncbi:MAG: hypothetical protein M1832_005567 [Thelocarpon impressellum]|nr:MAG: hypothetical protein M1832_005567 [Thelocarpon impressellum]